MALVDRSAGWIEMKLGNPFEIFMGESCWERRGRGLEEGEKKERRRKGGGKGEDRKKEERGKEKKKGEDPFPTQLSLLILRVSIHASWGRRRGTSSLYRVRALATFAFRSAVARSL